MIEPRVESPEIILQDPAIEADHRISNHLASLVSILQRQAAAIRRGPEMITRGEAIDALTDAVSMVLAVSRLHHIFAAYPARGALDLGIVLTDMLEAFQASRLFGDRLQVHSTLGAGCKVRSSDASKLAFAFAEIVTNAMKYAHPSGLPVELTIVTTATPGGGVTLEVADDGVGLPENFVEARDAGVGLKLVRSLVESLGGSFDLKSNPLGLICSIHLPPIVRVAAIEPLPRNL
jgi:two-component sensor histidine kinase